MMGNRSWAPLGSRHFCIRVYDVGKLMASTSYEVKVVHP